MNIKSPNEVITELSTNENIPPHQLDAINSLVSEMSEIGVNSIEYRNQNYVFKNKIKIGDGKFRTSFGISIRRLTNEDFIKFCREMPEKYRKPSKCKCATGNKVCNTGLAMKKGKINSFICNSGWLHLPCEMDIVPYVIRAYHLAKSKSQYPPDYSNDLVMI